MILKNNPDFSDDNKYKDDAWRGFSTKEILVLVAAFAAAICVIYLLWKYLDISTTIAPYIAVPLAAPVVFLGLYKYQGMTCLQLCRVLLDYMKTRCLCRDTGAVPWGRTFHMKKRKEKKDKRDYSQCEFIIPLK